MIGFGSDKKMCRPMMAVWSSGTFILRWSCYNTKQELNAHWSIYPTHQIICRPPLSNHVVDMSHTCWYEKFPDDWRDQAERQKTRSGKWKWHFSGIPMTLSGSDYFDKERTGLTLPKGHLRRKTTFSGQKKNAFYILLLYKILIRVSSLSSARWIRVKFEMKFQL